MSGRMQTRAIKLDRPEERGEERAAVSLGEDSAFNLPQSFLQKYPDKSFAYIPYMCGGVQMVDDYYDAVHKRHFSPVLVTEFPELSRRTVHSPFPQTADDDLIKVKGQVLMVRDADEKKREDQKYDEFNARQEYIKSLHTMDPHNPHLLVDDRRWAAIG